MKIETGRPMFARKPDSFSCVDAPNPMDFVYEKVSVEDAKKARDGDINDSCQEDWTDKRRPVRETTLLATTVSWLNDLPEVVRPVELAQRYPRIVNDLCRLWKTPAQWDRYMDDLLVVRRETRTRQGFPAQVVSELAALGAHHATLYPAAPAGSGPMARGESLCLSAFRNSRR